MFCPALNVALELTKLQNQRCREFNAQTLDTYVRCPYCQFPKEGAWVANLAGKLAEIEKHMTELWAKWQQQIFHELPGLARRIPLLSPARQALIWEIMRQQELPEIVSDDLLAALAAF
jgi:hypothetical protein